MDSTIRQIFRGVGRVQTPQGADRAAVHTHPSTCSPVPAHAHPPPHLQPHACTWVYTLHYNYLRNYSKNYTSASNNYCFPALVVV